ncbi:MAG: shikimate dehydrogenase [Pirellulales bacterium]|nr:shikimate dehydrogenase [Pirellulales bacterium]
MCSLFGQPVAENPTQYMLERAFQHHGLDWRYITLEISPADLPAAVLGMRAMGFRGGNCTIPHKVAVIEHLDEIAESASLMGAVNCIVRRGDRLVGENTDGKGFLTSLREVTDPRGKRVVLLGAGGAARAIGVELALAGAAEIRVVNRNPDRGESLVELLNDKTPTHAHFVPWTSQYALPEATDVLVQCTSIGLFPDVDARVRIEFDTLRPGMIVADVIPNPPATHLIREAKARGCTTLDGLGMLVNQGVIGFKLWTGVDPDPAVMREALEEVFN